MFPPYTSDEVAQAVLRRLRQAGFGVAWLEVTADDAARAWRLSAGLEAGGELTARYPFATARGIGTPAELADWFAAEVAVRRK